MKCEKTRETAALKESWYVEATASLEGIQAYLMADWRAKAVRDFTGRVFLCLDILKKFPLIETPLKKDIRMILVATKVYLIYR